MNVVIDAKSIRDLSDKLGQISAKGMPKAVRGTLNTLAFDVKQRTMPKSASETFVQRSKNFFKANSRVEMAKGNNLDSMQSTVGFIGRDTSEQAVKELQAQEEGGDIQKRSFIPLTKARSGGAAKQVRPSNRLSQIRNLVKASDIKAMTEKQKFRAAAAKAGPGGHVLGNNAKKTLWRIDSVERGRKIRKRPLYSFEEGRDVQVKATHFMQKAALEPMNRMVYIFADEAKKVFK